MKDSSCEHEIPYLNALGNNLSAKSTSKNPPTKNNFIILNPKNIAPKSWVKDQIYLEKPMDAASNDDVSDLRFESFSRPLTETPSPLKTHCANSPESSPTARSRIKASEIEESKLDEKNAALSVLFQEDLGGSQKESGKSLTQAYSEKICEEKPNKILAFLQNKWTILLIAIFTLFALYADDVRLLAFPKAADPVFSALTIIVICTFCIEIILNLFSKSNYEWSFFFFMDLISTISLIFDIPLVSEAIFYPSPTVSSQTTAANFGKNGAKAIVGLRFFRLVRFFRIGKIYKDILRLKKEYDNYREQRRAKQKEEELKQREYKEKVLETFQRIGTRKRRVAPLQTGNNHQSEANEVKQEKEKEGAYMKRRDSLSLIRSAELNGIQDSSGRKDSLGGLVAPRNIRSSIISSKNGSSINQLTDSRSSAGSVIARGSWSAVLSGEDPEKLAVVPLKEIPVTDHPLSEIKVGKVLFELTTKRLMFTVILVLLVSPAFEEDYYIDTPTAGVFLTEFFVSAATIDPNSLLPMYNSAINDLISIDNPLIYLKVPEYSSPWTGNVSVSSFRNSEISLVYWGDQNDPANAVAIFNEKSLNQFGAALRIGWTTFICIAFLSASISFFRVMNTLLINPLEKMISKVNTIAHDPSSWIHHQIVNENTKDMMETVQITNAIIRMGALLCLSLGKIGTEIFLKNMESTDDIHILKQGNKRLGVFGYCGIRNFTEIAEYLDENVVAFINVLASVIHRKVIRYQGSPCQMFRNSFFSVWNFLETDQVEMKEGNLALKLNKRAMNMCNLSIIAFLKIHANIVKNVEIAKYNSNSKIKEKLLNFKVSLGYGLHFGWAIEGTVGSEHKIDACFLSAHINITYQLEIATKIYGVPLLLSGRLQSKCSDSMKKIMRRIDKVLLKGTNDIMDIYTIDIDISKLSPSEKSQQEEPSQKKGRKRLRIDLIQRLVDGKARIESLLQTDNDLYLMTKDSNEGLFAETWNNTLEAYLKGEWLRAKRLLSECQALRPNDEPCKALHAFLSKSGFLSPLKWPGYRDLKTELV